MRLSRQNDIYLHYVDRLTQLLRDIASPRPQYPSLISFLGKRKMERALRDIFTQNNFRRGQRDGFVNLRIDATTAGSDCPVLFADGDLDYEIPAVIEDIHSHRRHTLPIHWTQPQFTSIPAIMYARLIFLFTDVICIFADDYGGLERVAALMRTWAIIGSASTLPTEVRPRVVIVVSDQQTGASQEIGESEEFHLRLGEQDPKLQANCWSAVKLVRLAEESISSPARHRRLREILRNEVDVFRDVRIQYRALYSATHLISFFDMAVHHSARSMTLPFSFIGSSRAENPISTQYGSHLYTFLDLAHQNGYSIECFCRFVASTILMDAYPPGMHSM
jgi:hypothetical protein